MHGDDTEGVGDVAGTSTAMWTWSGSSQPSPLSISLATSSELLLSTLSSKYYVGSAMRLAKSCSTSASSLVALHVASSGWPATAFKHVKMVHINYSAKVLVAPVFAFTLPFRVPIFASRAAFLAALFFSRRLYFSLKAARDARIWLGQFMSLFSSSYFLASR